MGSILAAAIVDWAALGKVVLVSLVGGVGLTAVFSVAVAGAVSFVDFRRDGRHLQAGVFALIAVVALGACLAAIVYGIAQVVSR